MSTQFQFSSLDELCLAVQNEERELIRLDLILVDYHAELTRLIREIRRLRDHLFEAEGSTVYTPES